MKTFHSLSTRPAPTRSVATKAQGAFFRRPAAGGARTASPAPSYNPPVEESYSSYSNSDSYGSNSNSWDSRDSYAAPAPASYSSSGSSGRAGSPSRQQSPYLKRYGASANGPSRSSSPQPSYVPPAAEEPKQESFSWSSSSSSDSYGSSSNSYNNYDNNYDSTAPAVSYTNGGSSARSGSPSRQQSPYLKRYGSSAAGQARSSSPQPAYNPPAVESYKSEEKSYSDYTSGGSNDYSYGSSSSSSSYSAPAAAAPARSGSPSRAQSPYLKRFGGSAGGQSRSPSPQPTYNPPVEDKKEESFSWSSSSSSDNYGSSSSSSYAAPAPVSSSGSRAGSPSRAQSPYLKRYGGSAQQQKSSSAPSYVPPAAEEPKQESFSWSSSSSSDSYSNGSSSYDAPAPVTPSRPQSPARAASPSGRGFLKKYQAAYTAPSNGATSPAPAQTSSYSTKEDSTYSNGSSSYGYSAPAALTKQAAPAPVLSGLNGPWREGSRNPVLREGEAAGRILFIDSATAGCAGNMLVAALLDMGVPKSAIEDGLRRLNLSGYSTEAILSSKSGIVAPCFVIKESTKPTVYEYPAARRVVESSSLAGRAKNIATDALKRLAEAEARAQGRAVDSVKISELSVVEIVAAAVGMAYLGCDDFITAPMPLGRGVIHDAVHGPLPNPSPATLAALIEAKVPTFDAGVNAELVNPTGAVLVAAVAQSFARWPSMVPERSSYGLGVKDVKDRPNLVRLVLGQMPIYSTDDY